MFDTPDGTITFLVIVLLAVSWLTTVWALGLKADAEQRLLLARPEPRHRAGARTREVTADPFPDWAFQPQPADRRAVSIGVPHQAAPRPVVVELTATVFVEPPMAVFVRQTSVRPDGSDHVLTAIAAGWDQWNGSRATGEMRALPADVLPLAAPIEVAA